MWELSQYFPPCRRPLGGCLQGPTLEESFPVQAFILSSCLKGTTERVRACLFKYLAAYDQVSLSSECLDTHTTIQSFMFMKLLAFIRYT